MRQAFKKSHVFSFQGTVISAVPYQVMSREFSKAFYNSKRWQDVRAYVLLRDAYKCQACGQTGALEVHHIIHLTPDNINDAAITLNDRNLRTLCRDCHFKEHETDKLSGNKNKNGEKSDCGAEFYFDDNGFLVKRPEPGDSETK